MSAPTRPDVLVDAILHPGERDRFVAMCRVTDPGETAELRRRVVAHLGRIEGLLDERSTIDADASRQLAAALLSALDDAPALSEGRLALLRGALEYYVDESDSISDLDDPTGFDDDIRVANAVFREIGRDDLVITP
ncbi:MAG: hypothetical protein AAFZ07_21260 [Actinomycetota bacterium]